MADEHLTMILSYEVDQYQLMIKSKQLIQSLSKWREQATKLEMLLTDCMDYQCLKREREVLVTCMDNVDDASTTFVDLYLDVDIPIDMEDLEIYNYELVKRICPKLSMLKDTNSNVSKVYMISSSTFRLSDTGMQAAAIAAELEVKLQSMHMAAERYELERNRTEKELAIAMARFRAVNEVSQTRSVTIERRSYVNCIDGFMQLDSVHYPVNEMDNQFEGSVVVPPGGCFGTSPLEVRFFDPFVVGGSCGDKLDGWHGVVSRDGLGLQSFVDCPSRCETAIANISSLGAFSEGRGMQALQSKRSEWVGLSGPNVQLVISTKSATDEIASIRTISDQYVRPVDIRAMSLIWNR